MSHKFIRKIELFCDCYCKLFFIMGLSCCKYYPNDIEQMDLIHVLKHCPAMFDVADIRIFEYYRKNQNKFKKLLDKHLTIDEITRALSYLLSIKHIKDSKNFRVNIKKFNMLKVNNYKNTTKDLMTIEEKTKLNDFLFIMFMYEISIKSKLDYDERKSNHQHHSSPISVVNKKNNTKKHNDYGSTKKHNESQYNGLQFVGSYI